MNLDSSSCIRALRTRDRRFDGRLFAAVVTTGIYCRPICPVRPARAENIRFFPSAAAAESQGFRPCLRCRPERAPGFAGVDAISRLVGAAVAGIEEHALSSSKVGELALALGVSDRHLRRATHAELGVSPIELAQTHRLLLAKRLLAETSLSQTEIAFASGFGSVRRFNALFKSRYGLCPRSLRQRGPKSDGLHCQLEFRPPLAWESLLAYLGARAIPGIEMVDRTHYRRTVGIGEHEGWIGVTQAKGARTLDLDISPSLVPVISAVVLRVKRLFDLGADPEAVSAQLGQDPLLGAAVRRIPGLRVPGAFDGFELAVRAILGQQVSIRSATTLARRWAQRYGQPIVTPYAGLDRLAPTPAGIAALGDEEIAALGIVGARARAIVELARRVAAGELSLGYSPRIEASIEALRSIPGVGAWTAEYIAMRALQWPDAFPGGDLVLRRVARMSESQLRSRAQAWRPWRSYAAHYLWSMAGAVK
jgi:AraC family transcriptional regulator, regulatory protein of adaptative response / DNA-3-methyladenine glycosylase II